MGFRDRGAPLGALLALFWAPVVLPAQDSQSVLGRPDVATYAVQIAELGRKLFFDKSLSASGKLSCGTCHDPRYAYGPAPGRAIALGGKSMDQTGTRAVPSLRYLRNVPDFALGHRFTDGDLGPIGGYTWDGRASNIREQARLPLLAANEMANPSPADVVRRLRNGPYAGRFRALFGADVFSDPARAFDSALRTLEAFQATPAEFFPYSSRYDAFLRGEIELDEREERGVALFKDPNKGNCASCHLVVSRAGVPPSFTDYDFANVGVPRNRDLSVNADPNFYDLGLCGPNRQGLRDRPQYCGFFRAPTLRNVAIRDAFFHNGVFHELRTVLEFYVERDLKPEKYYARNADGSVRRYDDLPPGSPDNIDRDAPLNREPGSAAALTGDEIEDLIAFLETLTDRDALPGQRKTPQVATLENGVARPGRGGEAAWDPRSSDEHAWRLFLAVNAPVPVGAATDGPRDTGRRHVLADEPAVWETWLNTADVYLADGRDAGPWNTVRARSVTVADETRFEIAAPLDTLTHVRHIVAGRMEDVDDPLAAAARLTEIRMNRQAYEYIRANELYDVEGQRRAIAAPRGVHFPSGSIELKARWRPINSDERGRYHTLTVHFRDGSERLYGMTALHIASKDLPTWFWATFEHADNEHLPDGEGWQLPSVDRFACADRSGGGGCDRAPRGLGLEGTVWENYRLRGTLTRPIDGEGRPLLLANSEFEARFQRTSSCITCHARAAMSVRTGDPPARLPIFAPPGVPLTADSPPDRRGYVGLPQPSWYEERGADGEPRRVFQSLDFVWSLAKAQPRHPPGR